MEVSLHTINYTYGNICRAASHLAVAPESMPRRAWDAYNIAIRGEARNGMESEFAELDSIFGDIRWDQVEERITVTDAQRGASLLLQLQEAIANRASE